MWRQTGVGERRQIIPRYRQPRREEFRRGRRQGLLLLAATSGAGRVRVAAGRRGGRGTRGRRLRFGEVQRGVEVLERRGRRRYRG